MAAQEQDTDDRFAGLGDVIVFIPCCMAWMIFVLFMLPVTVLAFPAQYLLRNRPRLQGDVVTALIALAAVNAIVSPLAAFYFLSA